MLRLLIACLALASLAAGASAAERSLLFPQQLKASGMARSATLGQDPLAALRRTAAEAGSVSVVVGLRVPFAAEGLLDPSEASQQRADIAATAAALRARFATAVARAPGAAQSFASIPFLVLQVTPDELERLAADPDVISLRENQQMEPMLVDSVPMIRATTLHQAAITGTGQTVAVIDSGVDTTHPFLRNRVVSEACYSTTIPGFASSTCPGGAPSSTAVGSATPCTFEQCEHGTHVAGIVAGMNNRMSGVAPGASIIAIKVSSNLAGQLLVYNSDVVRGLQRVYELRDQYNIAAVNLSLGSRRLYTSNCDAASADYFAAVANLKSVGIATIASTGNDGITDAIASPACLSNVVSVGAVSTKNWQKATQVAGCSSGTPNTVACYSNTASFLSLLAPGSPVDSSVPNGGYAVEHGTSMAAPHVAGAWALLKQRSPAASVDTILAALKTSGRPITDSRPQGGAVTKPLIDVTAALNLLAPPVLSYVAAGSGSGSIDVSAAGNSATCTASCNSTYPLGTRVTLTATAGEGSTFQGWSGACSGTRSCTITMSGDRTVTARFSAGSMVLSYATSGTGEGSILMNPPGASGGACTAGICRRLFDFGSNVQLTAQEGAGSRFAGWSGDCTGSGSCVLTMSGARQVTAAFEALPPLELSYSSTGTGAGSVTFTQGTSSATCRGTCTRSYRTNQTVTLTVAADPGSIFDGWSGACTGTGACSVTMSSAQSVTASFSPVPVELRGLSYTRQGTGAGSVAFSPAGTLSSCTESCTSVYSRGTRVSLQASAAPGSKFKGWQGACTGTRACSVNLSDNTGVTAVFDAVVALPLTYAKLGDGTGMVRMVSPSGSGTCDASCVRTIEEGMIVTLTAWTDSGSRFAGWGGACQGRRTCTLRMSQAQDVTATFTAGPVYTLSYDRLGTGTGQINVVFPRGLAGCTDDCTRSFAPNTRVTLSATPGPGAVFNGWGGNCRGTRYCRLTLRDARSVTATFTSASSASNTAPVR